MLSRFKQRMQEKFEPNSGTPNNEPLRENEFWYQVLNSPLWSKVTCKHQNTFAMDLLILVSAIFVAFKTDPWRHLHPVVGRCPPDYRLFPRCQQPILCGLGHGFRLVISGRSHEKGCPAFITAWNVSGLADARLCSGTDTWSDVECHVIQRRPTRS